MAKHQVKRAIINAAGKGERLRPVTLTTPKPLVKVNGVRMIDTIIDALHKNGINDIVIVTGYLKEQFKVLEKEYIDITIVENPYCATCNNISSLYSARQYLNEDLMILDGDFIIYNSDILTAEFDYSGYNCVWTDTETDEWVLTTNAEGFVTSCTVGAEKGWQLYGVSRWTKEDAQKLKHHLEVEFEEKENKQLYWDNLALTCYPNEYQMTIHKINIGDIIELDNFSELVDVDPSYARYAE